MRSFEYDAGSGGWNGADGGSVSWSNERTSFWHPGYFHPLRTHPGPRPEGRSARPQEPFNAHLHGPSGAGAPAAPRPISASDVARAALPMGLRGVCVGAALLAGVVASRMLIEPLVAAAPPIAPALAGAVAVAPRALSESPLKLPISRTALSGGPAPASPSPSAASAAPAQPSAARPAPRQPHAPAGTRPAPRPASPRQPPPPPARPHQPRALPRSAGSAEPAAMRLWDDRTDPIAPAIEQAAARVDPDATPDMDLMDIPSSPMEQRALADARARRGEDPASTAPAAPYEPGLLNINSRPWSHVYVDDQPAGNTPLRALQLSPGPHRVRLVNRQFDLERSFTVNVSAGKSLTYIESLTE